MYEKQSESRLIECLNKYFKFFKLSFSLQLSLFESFFNENDSSIKNRIRILEKLEVQAISLDFEHSPFEIGLSSSISFERFYLRLMEFLEYRFSIIRRAQAEKRLDRRIENFYHFLYTLFQAIWNPGSTDLKTKIQNLGELLNQINSSAQGLISDFFGVILKENKSKSILEQEILQVKQLIEEKITAPTSQQIKLLKEGENPQKDIVPQYFGKNNKCLENLDVSIEQSLLWNCKVSQEDGMEKVVISSDGYQSGFIKGHSGVDSSMITIKKQEAIEEGSENLNRLKETNINGVVKKSRHEIHSMMRVMDIEPTGVCSSEYVLRELNLKNSYNRKIIKAHRNKYQRKFQKKQKRFQRRSTDSQTQEPSKEEWKLNKFESEKLTAQKQHYINSGSMTLQMLEQQLSSSSAEKSNKKQQIKRINQGLLEDLSSSETKNPDYHINYDERIQKTVQDELLEDCKSQSSIGLSMKPIFRRRSTQKSNYQKKTLMKAFPVDQNKFLDSTIKDSFIFKDKETEYFQQLRNRLKNSGSDKGNNPKLIEKNSHDPIIQYSYSQFSDYERCQHQNGIFNQRNSMELISKQFQKGPQVPTGNKNSHEIHQCQRKKKLKQKSHKNTGVFVNNTIDVSGVHGIPRDNKLKPQNFESQSNKGFLDIFPHNLSQSTFRHQPQSLQASNTQNNVESSQKLVINSTKRLLNIVQKRKNAQKRCLQKVELHQQQQVLDLKSIREADFLTLSQKNRKGASINRNTEVRCGSFLPTIPGKAPSKK